MSSTTTALVGTPADFQGDSTDAMDLPRLGLLVPRVKVIAPGAIAAGLAPVLAGMAAIWYGLYGRDNSPRYEPYPTSWPAATRRVQEA